MTRKAWLVCTLLASACGATEARLIPDSAIVGDALPAPLSTQPTSAAEGKAIFTDRNQGHCVLCHRIEGLDAPFQGNVGPDLTTVGDRLSPGQIRLRIVDYQAVKPGVLMPSYYRIHDLNQVGAEYKGQPALSAAAIENLVAFLREQKEDVS